MQRRPSVGIKGHRFNAADADAGVRMAENFRDNEDRSRFELDVEGIIAFITYRKSSNAITLVHTEVPPELGGRGIGSKLGRAVSVKDGLPKFRDLPAELGGSGETLAD